MDPSSPPYIGKHTPAEIAAAMQEMRSQTDRAAAIIAMAIIDNLLQEAIEKRLHSVPKTVRSRMFGNIGFIQTFQSKLDIALALGIITLPQHTDLDYMKRIRNRFAHSPVTSKFDDKVIQNICSNLFNYVSIEFDEEQSKPRNKFQICFLMHSVMLYYIARLETRVDTVFARHPDIGKRIIDLLYASQDKHEQEPPQETPPAG